MTLKIEISTDETGATIRLVGRLRGGCLTRLSARIEQYLPNVRLDLEQLRLVDLEAVRYLAMVQAQGVGIVGCPVYIMNWINLERR